MKGKVLAEEKADRIQGKSFQKPMDFVGNTYYNKIQQEGRCGNDLLG